MINIDPCEGFIRVYGEGKSFENEDSYQALMRFHALSPETVYISGLMGVLGKNGLMDIFDGLRDASYKRIIGYFPTRFLPGTFKPLPKTDLHMMELN